MNSLKLPSCNVSDLVQTSQDLQSRDEFKTLPYPTGQQWCFIPVWAASVFCGLRLSPLPSCRSVCLTCLLNRSFRLHRQTQALLPLAHHGQPLACLEKGSQKPHNQGGFIVCFFGGRCLLGIFYILLGAVELFE